MQKYAEYIKEIEIDSLWSGKKHVCWELHRQVNILSGINGVGKSTILNKVVRSLARGGELPSHPVKGVRLRVAPEEARWVRPSSPNSTGRSTNCSGSISTTRSISATA